MICMMMITARGGKGSFVARLTRFCVAPVKARIWEKAVAPVRIMNIIDVTFTLFTRALTTTSIRIPLYAKARKKQTRAPTAADSVGVETPRTISPITEKMTSPRGRIYFHAQNHFLPQGRLFHRVFGGETRIDQATDDNVGGKQKGHEQAREDNGEQEVPDRNLGQACQQNA